MMPDRIPLIEPVVGETELENIKDVLDSGYMTQGPYAQEFEERFADRTGVRHGITVTSCTTGMELALEALDVGSGDEVLLPDFTHPATGNVVERVGADPVLVDVDRETYNIDPAATREAVTDDTAALLPVAWGGQPLDPDPLYEIAAEHDLAIVEDAACGAGASYDGEPVGSQFDASAFSFHPRKVLTTGEGGMITTNDDELERTIRSIKNFGTDPSGDQPGFVRADATNYRFSDILAAVGVAQLERADEITERRREIAAVYDDLLEPVKGVDTPAVIENGEHNYQCYCVYIESGDDSLRDTLIDELGDESIETQIGTYALSETEAFGDATQGSDLMTAKDLYHNLLTLPVSHSMTDEDQHRVVNTLQRIVNDHTE
jgi:dTDP-4-amino-4,6-dideoxygalactose transaminase